MAECVRNLLLTGKPGVGKTTLIRRVVEGLPAGVRVSGFLTGEVREGRERVGFRIQTLGGEEGWLARKGLGSCHRVGRYGVDLEGFERIALPCLESGLSGDQLLVLDEIGKMEAFSSSFRRLVERAMDSSGLVLATIALRGGDWIRGIRERRDASVREVTRGNRDSLVEAIVAELMSMLPPAEGNGGHSS
jgi:nucleoside-triphosphatase THEP1